MTARGDREIEALEERLGHVFADRGLIGRALTHPSALSTGRTAADGYQRLEFLGDRVLGLTVADMLYRAFPDAEEGELAQRFNHLVRRETCAAVAIDLGLDRAMRVGAGEAQAGGRRKSAILGDVCEAVLAALYLEAGLDRVRPLVEAHWGPRMRAFARPVRDAKTMLQEWAQGRGLPTPTYLEIGRSGPDHAPVFQVKVKLEGIAPGEGTGRSKREAEQNAAAAILKREGLASEEDLGV